MANTVPNQRIVRIHREHITADFLGIKNENWKAAARDLGAQSLLLYMYFAANKDNFKLALSPAAIRQSIGMPPQTYRDQFLKLVDKGYLVQTGGNVYEFYETPCDTYDMYKNSENSSTSSVFTQTSCDAYDMYKNSENSSVSTTFTQTPCDTYNMYKKPENSSTSSVFTQTPDVSVDTQAVQTETAEDREIYINNSNKIDNKKISTIKLFRI